LTKTPLKVAGGRPVGKRTKYNLGRSRREKEPRKKSLGGKRKERCPPRNKWGIRHTGYGRPGNTASGETQGPLWGKPVSEKEKLSFRGQRKVGRPGCNDKRDEAFGKDTVGGERETTLCPTLRSCGAKGKGWM